MVGVRYTRRGLVDFRTAAPFIAVGAPVGLIGGVCSTSFDVNALRALYGVLMLGLSTLLITQSEEEGEEEQGELGVSRDK
jgi:uncharacterized membrane protein YfcA